MRIVDVVVLLRLRPSTDMLGVLEGEMPEIMIVHLLVLLRGLIVFFSLLLLVLVNSVLVVVQVVLALLLVQNLKLAVSRAFVKAIEV